GKIHHPAVDEPVLVRHARLEGMWLGRRFGGVVPRGPRDIRIDLAVERHNPFHGAHREIRLAAQAPAPKAPGIRMALLEMLHLQHDREPHLARRGVRRRALVREAGRIVALEARTPQVDRGTGDLQTLTNTALPPALRIEGEDLQAGLDALGMAVVVEQRPGRGSGWRKAVPETLCRLPRHAMHGGMK